MFALFTHRRVQYLCFRTLKKTEPHSGHRERRSLLGLTAKQSIELMTKAIIVSLQITTRKRGSSS